MAEQRSLGVHPLGINLENRALLEQLHRELPGAFDVAHAARALHLEPDRTRDLLAYLARRGWLTRVRRGLYVAVPLNARRSGEWIEDAWIVAERAFSPCYVAGWSACEHWGLTEQTFRTVLVVTSRKVRDRHPVMQGIPYRVTVRPQKQFFGLATTWREQVPVSVSDPSRTIVDLLDDPTLVGGIRNVADVVYGDRLGKRAVFKRLGFILEHLGADAPELVAACLERRSTGLIALDPSVKIRGRIVRRWGLRANVELGTPGGDW